MGRLYKASCEKCGYNTELKLGGGLASVDLSILLNVAGENDRAQLEQLRDDGRIESVMGEYHAVRCLNCSQASALREKCIVTVTDPEGNRQVFGNNCEYCGKQLTVFDIDEQSLKFITCPRCSNGVLRFAMTGLWD